MRVGVLTGGGDCPGLNAVIRAVVRKGVNEHGYEFLGFKHGWRGPLEGIAMPLGIEECRGILPRGGTILGSTLDKAGERRLVAILKDNPLGQGHESTPLGVVRAVTT